MDVELVGPGRVRVQGVGFIVLGRVYWETILDGLTMIGDLDEIPDMF